MKQTLGQKRVKAEFNPTKNGTVDELKNYSAKMIDILEKQKVNKHKNINEFIDCEYKFQKELRNISKSDSSERSRAISIAATLVHESLVGYERLLELNLERLNKLQTKVETACMYAVKANFIN